MLHNSKIDAHDADMTVVNTTWMFVVVQLPADAQTTGYTLVFDINQ